MRTCKQSIGWRQTVLSLVVVILLIGVASCSLQPISRSGEVNLSMDGTTPSSDQEQILDFRYTPTGGLLVNMRFSLRLVEPATRTTRWSVRIAEGCCADQVVNDQVVAVATARGEVVYVFELQTGNLLYRMSAGHQAFSSLALSADRQTLATGEYGQIRLWNATNGKFIKAWQTGDEGFPNFPWTKGVTNLVFLPNDDGLLSANWWSGHVMAWDIASTTIRSTYVLTNVVRYVLNPQVNQLLVDYNQFGFEMRDPQSGKLIANHPKIIGAAGFVNFSRDGKKVVVWGGDAASVWELADDRLIQEFRNGGGPGWRYAAFDPQGDTLALCDEDGREILFFDVLTGNRMDRLPMP